MQQLLLSLVTLETPNDTETAAVGILLPTEWSKFHTEQPYHNEV